MAGESGITGASDVVSVFTSSGSIGDSGSSGHGVRPSSEVRPAQERLTEMVRDVTSSVNLYEGHGSPEDEDRLFKAHTQCFVDYFADHDLRGLKESWAKNLEPVVKAREAQLGRPIHKGAPLHNTGLLFFADGDFDSALAYLAQAGEEDERAGRGRWHQVVIGDHTLSKGVLIEPLETELIPVWVASYQKITGRNLDSNELISLLRLIADRTADAIQAIIALHRIRRSRSGPQNGGTSVVRFTALADLMHLIESSLRVFQTGVDGELGRRIGDVLKHNPKAKSAYEAFANDFASRCSNNGEDRHSATAMNWIFNETEQRITSGSSPAISAGVAAFFCHQFRNALLHENNQQLSVFQTAEKCVLAAGWSLGTLRICMMDKEESFATLQ